MLSVLYLPMQLSAIKPTKGYSAIVTKYSIADPLVQLANRVVQEKNEKVITAFHAISKTAPFSAISGSLYFMIKG